MTDDTDSRVPGPTVSRAERLARAIRTARGHGRQYDFAIRLGRPQATLSYWENGRSVPSLDALVEIETALELPLGSLAAIAGYFTPEACGALAGSPLALRRYETRDAAIEAVVAADVLGMGVRLSNGGVRSDQLGPSSWLVEVTTELVGQLDADTAEEGH